MHSEQCSNNKNGQVCCPIYACPMFRRELYFALQHGDWRRYVAALLGRFLPKLRAAGNSGLFLGRSALAIYVKDVQVDHAV
jgi:hypothetical protein